jgi:hypothetical protein
MFLKEFFLGVPCVGPLGVSVVVAQRGGDG